MEKRYQVFVSSTYHDLQKERQEVMHALLELDCIPSGMELFPAANESQWSLIQRVIADCDYYILVLAGRYGSMAPDGVGYTEKEYAYALSIGKPTIAFLHRDPGIIPSNQCEPTQDGKQKLAAFRSLAEKKLCKYWSTPAELGSVVSRSLIQLVKTTPAIGWVRADELPNKDAALELLKLRQRVEILQSDLDRIRTTAPKGSESLAQGDDLFVMRYGFTADDELLHSSEFEDEVQLTWNSIFGALAPHMINEASEAGIKLALNEFVEHEALLRMDDETEFVKDSARYFYVREEDFHTVKIQLRALGLMVKSDKPRSVRDVATYWTLTPYGDDVMTRLRAIGRPGK